jgi:C-5 cytosine-specific DNA methylase
VRVLDLFCGVGGASVGYHRAGFEVIGVDRWPQPNYPFKFFHMDVWDFIKLYGIDRYDLIHASPPCQGYSGFVRTTDSKHTTNRGRLEPKLIDKVREAVTGKPYVIENVVGARNFLRNPVQLCGLEFGLVTPRHRLFETSFPVTQLPHTGHRGVLKRYAEEHGVEYSELSVAGHGGSAGAAQRWGQYMGIDWAETRHELSEAIPPVFTQYLAQQYLQSLGPQDWFLT